MTLLLAGILSGEFSKGVDARAHQKILWHLREQKERIEKLNPTSQRNQNNDGASGVSASIVSVEQLDLLQSEIDELQLATVEALIVQEKLIEAAREELKLILDQAYVMDDGRKIFKDRAGEKVYDADGNELQSSEISADAIPDYHPRFEDYWSKRQSLQTLEQEQDELLDYQSELDKAEQTLRQGDVTSAELDGLRQELMQNAPNAVQTRTSSIEAFSAEIEEAATAESATKANLDSEFSAMPIPSMGLGSK